MASLFFLDFFIRGNLRLFFSKRLFFGRPFSFERKNFICKKDKQWIEKRGGSQLGIACGGYKSRYRHRRGNCQTAIGKYNLRHYLSVSSLTLNSLDINPVDPSTNLTSYQSESK